MMRSSGRVLTLSVAILSVWLGMPSSSLAQTPEALAKVRDLNKRAVEAYENLDLEEARKALMQALELCATEGLNRNTLKAQTHVNLAVVLVGGLKQRDAAVKQFQRALEIDPAIKVPKRLSNPEIQSAFDTAVREMGNVGPSPPPPTPDSPPVASRPPTAEPPPSPPPAGEAIVHKVVPSSRTGMAVPVTARVSPALTFERLVLAYRPEGATDFLARDMEKDENGEYVARIPEPATHGDSVAYYVEARARNGQALASSGTSEEPHVVRLSADGPEAVAQVETTPEPSEEPRRAGTAPRVWLALGVGGGGGWAKGTPEVNRNYQDVMTRQVRALEWNSVALARLLHVLPEVGFFVNPKLLLSVQGRLQLTTGATEVRHDSCKPTGICEPASGAVAVLGKATWILRERETFRPFVSLGAGGGYIRYLVDLKDMPLPPDCGPKKDQVCVDTVAGGGFLVGPSAGFIYDVNNVLSITAALNTLVGVPSTAFNLDLNLGIAYRL
jgi:tetratricopeptide (TPR) repeat protein